MLEDMSSRAFIKGPSPVFFFIFHSCPKATNIHANIREEETFASSSKRIKRASLVAQVDEKKLHEIFFNYYIGIDYNSNTGKQENDDVKWWNMKLKLTYR